jgi:hypothetical protein
MVEEGSVKDTKEKEKLEHLIKIKKWFNSVLNLLFYGSSSNHCFFNFSIFSNAYKSPSSTLTSLANLFQFVYNHKKNSNKCKARLLYLV